MKKYVQLQDSYDSKKGDIWEEYMLSHVYVNENRKLYVEKSKIENNPDWFALYEEKKEYAKKWEDLKEISGSLVDGLSNISGTLGLDTIYQHRNIYATENQAKAALAEAQLSQLLKEIYEGEEWLPDWENNEQLKLCMCIRYGKVDITVARTFPRFFISLPTQELAEQFLKNHRELIETYFKKFEW